MELLAQYKPAPARTAFKEEYWEKPGWIAEEKLDGARYLMHISGQYNRFTGRRISVVTDRFTEKSDRVPHVADFPLLSLHGTVLDGEFVLAENTAAKKVTSIIGSSPEVAIAKQKANGWLVYKVWDCLFYKGMDIRKQPQRERYAYLLMAMAEINHPQIEVIKSTGLVKKAFYHRIVKEGGEGVILKDTSAPYGKGWVKRKKYREYDCVVMGYEAPKQFTEKVDGTVSISRLWENGWIGAIIFGQYKNGTLTELGRCSGMDDDTRAHITNNKAEHLDKVMIVRAQERHSSGALREPRFKGFRNDKNPTDCIFNREES